MSASSSNIKIVLLIILLSKSIFGQGLYWENSITGGMNEKTTRLKKSFYMPHMYKTFDVLANESEIIRFDRKLIIKIDYDQKTYSVTTFDEMDAMLKKQISNYKNDMAEIKKNMKNLSPEERKGMEEMTSKIEKMMQNEDFRVINTTEIEKISGYNCTRYLIIGSDNHTIEIWATKEISDQAAFNSEMKELMNRMLNLLPVGNEEVKELSKIDGFFILSEFMGIKSLVTKVEKRNTPVKEFEVPEGYKKVKRDLLEFY